ncbi:MAG TPA: DnaJ domain-containing protein [Candidatus Binatia bacterium]|nr:DnaJ domain-containing protein [Candidatus Binatia bacterium]
MTEPRDPYEVLGVPRTATTSQIRAAYVRQAWRAHPDLHGEDGAEAMEALNEAWGILKDAARRQAWDAAHHVPSVNGVLGVDDLTDAQGRPFWTGAMGRPPGRSSGTVLDFGIYAGWSLGEISRRDRGYLVWLRDRPEAVAIQQEIERLLDPDAEKAPAPRRGVGVGLRWRPGR